MAYLHFRVKFDAYSSTEEFYRKIGAPFLLEEIHSTFDMSSIDPIEALYMLDPLDPLYMLEMLLNMEMKNWKLCLNEGGSHCLSPVLINCTQESLALEYKDYKKYVINQRNELSVELFAKENSIKRKLN